MYTNLKNHRSQKKKKKREGNVIHSLLSFLFFNVWFLISFDSNLISPYQQRHNEYPIFACWIDHRCNRKTSRTRDYPSLFITHAWPFLLITVIACMYYSSLTYMGMTSGIMIRMSAIILVIFGRWWTIKLFLISFQLDDKCLVTSLMLITYLLSIMCITFIKGTCNYIRKYRLRL